MSVRLIDVDVRSGYQAVTVDYNGREYTVDLCSNIRRGYGWKVGVSDNTNRGGDFGIYVVSPATGGPSSITVYLYSIYPDGTVSGGGSGTPEYDLPMSEGDLMEIP